MTSRIEASDNNTIQRCPHDRENPYTMVNRDLIRDPALSPESCWLIIYLLSMDNGWKINIQQILNRVKPHMGKNKLYAIVNEAINAGYMMREEWFEDVKRADGTYRGRLKRVRYYISETPKFKKCLRHPCFRDPDNPPLRNKNKKEIKEDYYCAPEKPEPTVATSPPPAARNNNFSLPSKPKQKAQPPPAKTKAPPPKPPEKDDPELYPCLSRCDDLTPNQKKRFLAFPEPVVESIVEYCYHHSTQIKGGAVGRLKLMQHMAKNFDDYKDAIANLREPEKPRKVDKKFILDAFKKGQTYNGYEFTCDEIGAGFSCPGMYSTEPYSIKWKEPRFGEKFMAILDKLGIKKPE